MRTCPNCGSPPADNATFCANCGPGARGASSAAGAERPTPPWAANGGETSGIQTSAPAGPGSASPQQEAQPGEAQHEAQPSGAQPLGMKWYKFVIYVQLFLHALIKAATAILLLTGMFWEINGASADLVYAVFPMAHAWAILSGLLYLAVVAAAIWVRQQLAHFKRGAYKLLIYFYVASLLVEIVFVATEGPVLGADSFAAFEANGMTSSLAVTIANIMWNKSYFDKRGHLFVN